MNLAAGFQAVEWTDYAGGFTDNVYSDDTTKCALNRNLLIDRNHKTYLRPGSELYYPAAPQHPNGANRIQRFMKFPDETSLFAQSGAKLAYDTGSAWTELTGAHSAFPGMATSANVSWAYWNYQYFITNDAGLPVVRVFQNASNAWTLIQGGLPALDDTQYSTSQSTALASAITLANDCRTQLLAHFADVTAHGSASQDTHRAADTVSAGLLTSSACTNLATLLTLTQQMLNAYQNHHNDSQAAALYHYKEIPQTAWKINTAPYAGIAAPVATILSRTLDSVQVISPGETAATLVDAIVRLNDIKTCYNTHQGRGDIHGDGAGNNAEIDVVTTAAIYGFVQGPCIQLDQSKIFSYANQIKGYFNTHIAAANSSSTPYQHKAADTTNAITATNCTTPETLQTLLSQMGQKFAAHNADAIQISGWTYHINEINVNAVAYENALNSYQSPYIAPPYPDLWGGIRAGNWLDSIDQLNNLRSAMNGHFNDTPIAGALGAHWGPGTATVNPYQITGLDLALANYLYAFHYKYLFNVGTVQNQLVGPVLEVEAFNVIPTSLEGLAITNLPVLSNTSTQNYDTANITLEIYRTTDGGNTFYFVASVPNGTTSYTDYTTDTVLQGNEPIYTNGGVVDFDPVPIAKCVHIVNSTGYYGNIIDDTGQALPQRVLQSIQGAPDACPGDFFDDLRDPIVGITSVQTLPIVGCLHSIYRLEGAYTENGSGGITHQSISDTVGMVSEASIVRVDNGVFFAGTDGFYFTDGYQLKKVSDNWNTTYQALIATAAQAKRIEGAYDQLRRQIWWSCTLDPTQTDNDGFVMLDLNFGLDTPCWTTSWNPGHFYPTAHIFYQNNLVRGHELGYIFKHLYTLTEDPYVNTNVTPANWGTKIVQFDWKSTFVSWGSTNVRKWCPLVEYNLQNDTNLNLQVNGANDNDRSYHVLTPLLSHTHWSWGEETSVWGNDIYLWDFQGNLDQKRYVPAGSLRCTYKQIEFTNAWVTYQTSHDKGTATVSASGKTVTLTTSGKHWPLQPEGYVITFSGDNYTNQFEICAKNSLMIPTVLTVLDPDSLLVNGTYSWEIQGYEKGQSLHLLDHSLWGKMQGLSQTGARSSGL